MRVAIFDHMEEATEAEVQRMLPLVSEQRREQALRYKHTLGRFCCLKSWLMLQDFLPINVRYSDFQYNEHGKPYFEGGPNFSISHCKQGIAVVVNEKPIGIDIEAIRRADENLIARTMNEKERLTIKNDRDFVRLWTQKEAVVKMIGTGIEGFEQLQNLLPKYRELEISTFENEHYIYSIAINRKS